MTAGQQVAFPGLEEPEPARDVENRCAWCGRHTWASVPVPASGCGGPHSETVHRWYPTGRTRRWPPDAAP